MCYICGLETIALTEKQQEKVQVCENNWLGRIAGVKTVDKRRMDELRVEVGGKESFKKKLVRTMVKSTGYVERKGDEKLANRSNAQKEEGKRRRGRLRMRWEDCVKRDLERVGGEWRTTA